MFSCTRNTALSARLQFGPKSAAKRSCVVKKVVVRSNGSADGALHAKAMSATTVTSAAAADPNNDDSAVLCSRRRALLSAAAAAPLASALFSSFSSLAVAVPPAAAAAAKKLPKLDALKLYGSQEAAEAARAAAVAGARATLASVDPSSAGVLLRLAFHDAGTWDGAKRTGGANGSILNELERPENGGLKYGAALLGNARKASQAELPKGARQLTDADFIQVVGAAAVEAAGGPKIAVPLGRPDSRAKAGDPAGQLPSKDLSAQGLIDLFSSNGYSTRDMVALSGAHTIGLSRANDPKGPMTKTPGQFSNDYFQLLLKGGGAFPSDRTLVTDPATKKIVTEYAKNKGKFFEDFAAAYVRMGLKGLAEGEEA